MGEYIYLDKNQQEETSLLSVCNESDEQIRE